LHAAILAGGAGDDFLTGGVEFVLALGLLALAWRLRTLTPATRYSGMLVSRPVEL